MMLENNENIKFGRYKLPAEFPYLTREFITSLSDLTFQERIEKIYFFLSGKKLDETAFSKLDNAEFPLSLVTVDHGLAVLELNDGYSANYIDYIFVNDGGVGEVLSLSSIIISAYVDLVYGGMLNNGETFNLCFNGADGRLLLASYVCKLAKLPINTLIIGTDKPVLKTLNDAYIQQLQKGDCEVLISGVFEELDYLLDPVSAVGLVSYDLYYDDYEDDKLTVLLALASPHLFSRQVLKTVSGINEISVEKASEKLSELSALDIPSNIKNKKIQAFFAINSPITLNDALDIIKR